IDGRRFYNSTNSAAGLYDLLLLIADSINGIFAACRFLQPANQANKSCLSRTVFSDKPVDLAFRNTHSKSIQCLVVSIALLQSICFENIFHSLTSFSLMLLPYSKIVEKAVIQMLRFC